MRLCWWSAEEGGQQCGAVGPAEGSLAPGTTAVRRPCSTWGQNSFTQQQATEAPRADVNGALQNFLFSAHNLRTKEELCVLHVAVSALVDGNEPDSFVSGISHHNNCLDLFCPPECAVKMNSFQK